MSEIEYFYSAHSAFAYIGSARLMSIAAASGRRIAHRPVDLERVVAVTGPGWINNLTPARQAYFSGREIERWAEARGVPLMPGWPTFHDNDTTLPNCMLIAGQEQGANVDRFAHALLEAHWRDDADLADRTTLVRIATAVALDPVPIMSAALSEQIRALYEANTSEAIERSVFGSPTYFVDGDKFYGRDHLELIERALE
jgi:2-hydroxychromene-2-carboxylate isomerase